MILPYEGKIPVIGPNAFIAPTAVIIGDVTIAEGASIWYGAVVRGDLAPVTIGAFTNIQDNCTLHVDDGYPLAIGDNVTVGHNTVLHGATVEHHCLIGMGSVVMNGAWIKEGTIVAAGSLVKEKQVAGPFHLVAGNPAALKKDLTSLGKDFLQKPADQYRSLAEKHMTLYKPETLQL